MEEQTPIDFKTKRAEIESRKAIEKNIEVISKELAEQEGVNVCIQNIVDTSEDIAGIMTFTFDFEGKPQIAWGGTLDTFACLGALEFAKNTLISQLIYSYQEDLNLEFEFENGPIKPFDETD